MNVLDIALTRGYFGRELNQVRMFYTADNMPEFIGIAERGRATDSPGWFIVRLSYSVDNLVTTILAAPRNSILDNKGSLNYV